MENIGIDGVKILFQIINFSVVIGALTYLLYKPILKVLEERSKKIEEAQIEAQKALQEKEKIEEMKKAARKEAEKEAAKIIEEAKKTAEDFLQQNMDEARNKAKSEIARMKADYQEQQAASMKNMKQEFSDAVIAVSEKVIGQSLDKKAQAKLVDAQLDELLKTL